MFLTRFDNNNQNIKDLKETFVNLDSDYKGKLSFSNFYKCIENMGIKYDKSDLLVIFNNIDLDQDGFLDYDEFVAAL